MKEKKKCSAAQLAQRRANAAARCAAGRKSWVTMRVEPDAKARVTEYVNDPENDCPTISEALRRNF